MSWSKEVLDMGKKQQRYKIASAINCAEMGKTMKQYDFLCRLGLSVKKYRIASGYSQEELSARIDCDKNTIGKIERGESDFRISTLNRLARGLDISCSRLLKEIEYEDSDAFSTTIEYDYLRLFEYCHQLSPEQFNNLCNTAHLYVKANKDIK